MDTTQLWPQMEADKPPVANGPLRIQSASLAALQCRPPPLYLALAVRSGSRSSLLGSQLLLEAPPVSAICRWYHPLTSPGDHEAPLPASPVPSASPCHITSNDTLCIRTHFTRRLPSPQTPAASGREAVGIGLGRLPRRLLHGAAPCARARFLTRSAHPLLHPCYTRCVIFHCCCNKMLPT